jgi:hypothetical protein
MHGSSRREFVAASIRAGLGVALGAPLARVSRPSGTARARLRVLAIARQDELAALEPALVFAGEEGDRSAALLGSGLELVLGEIPQAPAMADARVAALLRERSPHAVLAFVEDVPTLGAMSLLAARQRVAVIDAACTEYALRDTRCHPALFHVAPSGREMEAALAGARRRDASLAADATVVTWHPSLRRFGAAQLNERFERRVRAPMQPRAWNAWFGCKLLVEAALRGRAGDAAALLVALRDPRVVFDGHKGAPLRLDPRTGSLRQPLYVLARQADDAQVVAEVAPIDVAPQEPLATCATVTP